MPKFIKLTIIQTMEPGGLQECSPSKALFNTTEIIFIVGSPNECWVEVTGGKINIVKESFEEIEKMLTE